MAAEEAAVLRQRLHRTVDVHVPVRQFAASLARVGEQHADAAVDVDLRVGLRRAGACGQRVELGLALGQGERELLQQQRALVERQRALRCLADRAGMVEGGGEVESFGADPGDLLPGRGVADDGGFSDGVRCPPRILQVARYDLGR